MVKECEAVRASINLPVQSSSAITVCDEMGSERVWLYFCRYVGGSNDQEGWSTVAPMSKIRGSLALSFLGGTFYAIGGGIPSEQYSLVEGYATISYLPLHKQDSAANLCPCRLNDSILIVWYSVACMSFVCCRYDPITNRWRIMPQGLQTPRFSPASSVVMGSIVCVRGLNGSEYMDTAESFDPREGRSALLPHIS